MDDGPHRAVTDDAHELPPNGDPSPSFRAAAVQAAPVFLDRDATIEKLDGLVADAAAGGARLVVLGESFVPAFPLWNLIHAPMDQHRFFRSLYEQALLVPGPHSQRIGAIARQHGVFLSVGVTERSPISMGGLYNTNLLFDPSGALINRHRKLVPTWAEKLTWAPGDASQLRPAETEIGRIGVLICGENTNTLARYALLAQGEQVHLASYPPAWPFRRAAGAAGDPDAEHGSGGRHYSLTRAIEIRTGAHAFEGKVFNIAASVALDERSIEIAAGGDRRAEEALRQAPQAVSMIVHPSGELCADPLVGAEGIVFADIDLGDSIEEKQAHDIVGHYQRFDIFRLQVDRRPQEPIELLGDDRRAVPAPAAQVDGPTLVARERAAAAGADPGEGAHGG